MELNVFKSDLHLGEKVLIDLDLKVKHDCSLYKNKVTEASFGVSVFCMLTLHVHISLMLEKHHF